MRHSPRRDVEQPALLGPTINIQRAPLGGRGFESYSEDGVLSGTLAGHYCKGVQAEGIIATLKHFVCNDLEHERMAVNSIVTDRALRENYLLPFQIALRIEKTGALMTAYNKVNGTHMSEKAEILTDIVRKEWKYDGLFMSDWYGTYSTSDSINAGLEIEMPGPTRWRGEALVHAVGSRKVLGHVLDARVRKILELINLATKSGIPESGPEKSLDRPQDKALLRRVTSESIVLLKNEGGILPFKPDEPVAIIGPNSKTGNYCGGGSASLTTSYVVTPFEGIKAQAKSDIHWTQGAYGHRELPVLSSKEVQTASGEPGITFRAYNEPASVAGREAVDEMRLNKAVGFLVDYKHPKIKSHTYYVDLEAYFTPEDSGTYDFGVSVTGTGKFFIDGELIVDNTVNQERGSLFFGTGTVEKVGSKELEAGKKYKFTFEFGSGPTTDLKLLEVLPPEMSGFRVSGCRRIDIQESIAKAVELASQHKQVVIIAGLNDDWESEGYDRQHMDLPPHTDELISRVLAANPNAAIVMQSGTPVTMPWAADAKALMHAWYGGNETGNGIADVLFGAVNPSGKLSLSFPVRLEDNPAYLSYRSERGRVLYSEDVYVGYRWYDKLKLAPLFPFGYGLSYTTFSRGNVRIVSTPESDVLAEDATITVNVSVTNTGSVAGAETVQIFVAPPSTASLWRPPRELKGFKKVFLQPGESKDVELVISKRLATSFWDEDRDAWISEKGTYGIRVEGTGPDIITSDLVIENTHFWNGL
ncbi:glycosyl hydrolase family 3 C-terminal domain-containing protein [Lineolata rhizophorae]|uniref:Probable beta-glucosidase I n=1 Tax=Lineolata rhizophorae TaxID=578093 RepID=A0A6A6P4A4_9PEZI|nr:glycosyl hydrolase family 3 C-terminal domain-containing protein [Lineolata rhizophorae]